MLRIIVFISIAVCGSLSTAALAFGSASLVSEKKVCIAGAGPCGLFLAGLLLQEDPSVTVEILEKAPRQGIPGQAFGIGMNPRLRQTLDAVHGLRPRVESIGAKVNGLNETLIARRQDICEQMTCFLEEKYPDRCAIHFEQGCEQVNMAEQTIVTTNQETVTYDLLIGSDGINSVVRRQSKNIRVLDHYVLASRWKALFLPPQKHIEPDSFQPLKHPSFAGRILPRHPDGHIALFFWDDNGKPNPDGIETVKDLEESFTAALQGKQRNNLFRRMLGMGMYEDLNETEVSYDKEALKQCFDGRAGISHYLKLDKYNDGVVALLGDSAHGMYTLLGQGCACGLENAVVLGKCLTSKNNQYETIEDALQAYSDAVVPESHAITDLNLITHVLKSNVFVKAIAFPPIVWSAIRGKMLMKRVVDTPYTQVLKENRFIIALSKRMWKRQRKPATRS